MALKITYVIFKAIFHHDFFLIFQLSEIYILTICDDSKVLFSYLAHKLAAASFQSFFCQTILAEEESGEQNSSANGTTDRKNH